MDRMGGNPSLDATKSSAPFVRVSIVVPTYNQAKVIPNLLKSIREQMPEGWEIILVDDCSTDGTSEAGCPFADKHLRTEKNSGPAAARNLGVQHARGKHILFIDSDVTLMPGLMAEVDHQLAIDPDLEALSFPTSPDPTNPGFFADYSALQEDFYFREYLDRVPSADRGWITTRFGVVRKDILEELGGFDERYRRPSIEDGQFSRRFARKHQTKFCLKPLPYHSWPNSPKQLVIRLFRNSCLWMAAQQNNRVTYDPMMTTPKRGVTVTIAGFLLLCLPLAAVRPKLWWVFVVLVVIHSFITMSEFKHFVKGRGISFALKAHFLNILLSIPIISGALLGMLSKGKRSRVRKTY